jgi:hypothetical protein
MAVHRRGGRKPYVPPQTSRVGSLSAFGGGDLGAAARSVAEEAQELASAWSAQIPPNISVEVAGRVATISADVGPARPGELRLRHPLFGDRGHWYGPPGEPFLAPAADAKADAAMARYAKKIDGWARRAGYR